MKTVMCIWSRAGNTPVTNREGSYCDVLSKFEVECDSLGDAKETLKQAFENVKDAHSCCFYIPEHTNHNLNHQSFVGRVD